ncbi:MAG: IPT/TIG domain-containing protein, partial [Candidatus Poribacteria bacterium]
MGGYDGNIGGVTSMVMEYDPITDNWVNKAPMPEAREAFPAITYDGKIYILGGYVEPGDYNLSRIDIYDPITDKWITKGDMPSARSCGSASVVNGKIYVIGGNNGGFVSLTEEYDPITGIWTKKADMPTARQSLYNVAPVVNGKIYFIGGSATFLQVSLPAVEEYDPATDVWTKKKDMPIPNWAFGISEVNGKIFVIGGMGNRNVGNVYQTVEMYDPVTDTWTKKADMLSPRYFHSAIAVGAYIYIFGGSSNKTAVEVYDTGLGMEIKAISPQEVFTTGGTQIAISGSGFPSDLVVTIGDKPLLDQKVTYNLITGVVPPNTDGEKDIVFTVPSFNYSTIAEKLFYRQFSSVVVTKITPNNGKQAGGDIVNLSGSGFLPGAIVTIGGIPATNVGVTPTLITFTIPPGTEGTKDVVATNPDGQKSILRNAYTYNPFPIIDKISPAYGGPLAGGTEIIIEGTNFIQGVTVYIGSERIAKLDSFSTTELRFQTPRSTTVGMKPIRVVNPDGQEAVVTDGFKYNYPPSILSVEPNAGALEGGTWVKIKGRYFSISDTTGFHITIRVYVGGIQAGIRFVSEDEITIETPPSAAGVKDIKVENQDGQTDTLKNAFTYNPAPIIASITPNNGKVFGETKITIQGSGFMPGAKVTIGSVGQDPNMVTTTPIATWEYVSPTMMTAFMPPSEKPKTISIVVINPDDQKVILRNSFTYNYFPTITSVQPDNGPSKGGTKIAINGTGFLPGAKVRFGFYEASSVIMKDDSTIECITPSGDPGVVVVSVINPDTQTATKTDGFIDIGKLAYNYPNPFRASRGTT